MPAGPFVDAAAMQKWLEQRDADPAAVAFTVRSMPTDEVIGSIAIIRITPEHGVAELGYIWYAPAAQRTAANTEAVYLLLNYLLGELRYRRVEWKCDAANLRSRHAALRLGFQHEGIFRQHMIRKGHNRDTAWFSLLDKEWPLTAVALECWLAGDQSVSLAALKPVN
jgi:RimJ/RimL family protein N-acetyltransferase